MISLSRNRNISGGVTMHSKFARVIIDRAIRRELDYAVPESLSRAGRRWGASAGSISRSSALATVVALLEETNAKGVREIEAVIGEGPTLSEPLLELARWMCELLLLPDRNSHAQFVAAGDSTGGSRLEKAAVRRDRRQTVTARDDRRRCGVARRDRRNCWRSWERQASQFRSLKFCADYRSITNAARTGETRTW